MWCLVFMLFNLNGEVVFIPENIGMFEYEEDCLATADSIRHMTEDNVDTITYLNCIDLSE